MLKFFTLRGRFSGRLYYVTAHTFYQAASKVGIRPKHLILERSEVLKSPENNVVVVPFPRQPELNKTP